MNIVLTGFMGSGKTTIGKLISKTYGFKFVDTDMLIVRNAKISINEIFKIYGEEYFRMLENKVVENLYQKDNLVISTGGGTILNESNASRLSENSMIFYLMASPDIIYDRLQKDTERPLLQTENPKKRICELMLKRDAVYKKHADYIIDTDKKNAQEIAETVYNIFVGKTIGKTIRKQ